MGMKYVTDPILGHIGMSLIEKRVSSHPLVVRLNNTIQNSMAYRVYPSDMTSRYVHSLGVMHISSMIFRYGLANCPFDIKKEYLLSRYNTIVGCIEPAKKAIKIDHIEIERIKDRLYQEGNTINNSILLEHLQENIGNEFSDAHNLPFSAIRDIGSNEEYIKCQIAYYFLLQTLRLYALFHDIGHLPYSHLMERALEMLYEEEEEIIAKRDTMPDGKIHELIGSRISINVISNLLNSSNDDGCDKLVIGILISLFKEMQKKRNGSLNELYMICDVKYGIDADRIDFTQRDGVNSGLSRGTGDIERIVKLCSLVSWRNSYEFAYSIQTLNDIQQVLCDRTRMYRFLVSHHKVRKLDYLFIYSIVGYLKRKKSEEGIIDEIKNTDDITKKNYTITDLIRFCHTLCKSNGSDERLIELMIPLFEIFNDSWLLNEMAIYYRHLLRERPGDEVCGFLKEVIEGVVEYQSLWKRDHEYMSFISELCSDIKEECPNEFMKLELYNKHYPNKYLELSCLGSETDFKILKNYMIFTREICPDKFCRLIREFLAEKNCSVILAPIDYKIGVSDISDDDFELVDLQNIARQRLAFNKVSTIALSLRLDRDLMADFYIYYKGKRHDTAMMIEITNELKKAVAQYIKLDIGSNDSLFTNTIKKLESDHGNKT